MEAGDQVEGLHAVLLLVGRSCRGARARAGRVPGAGLRRRAGRDRGRDVGRERMDEVRARAGRRLLARVDGVVVVEVGPLARVLAVERRRVGGQAERLEVHRHGRAVARMVGIDLGVRDRLGQVLAEQDRAARGVDDRVVERGRARAVGHVPGELRLRGGAEQHQAGEVTALEGRGVARAGGAGAHGQRALDADVALQPRERLGAADARLDRVDREVVPRCAGDGDHAPGAVDRHAQVVVEGGDAAVELAEVHDGEPARRRRAALQVEPVEVGRVEAERRGVGAHEVLCDVCAGAAAGAAQRAVGAQQLARGAGQRVDVRARPGGRGGAPACCAQDVSACSAARRRPWSRRARPCCWHPCASRSTAWRPRRRPAGRAWRPRRCRARRAMRPRRERERGGASWRPGSQAERTAAVRRSAHPAHIGRGGLGG